MSTSSPSSPIQARTGSHPTRTIFWSAHAPSHLSIPENQISFSALQAPPQPSRGLNLAWFKGFGLQPLTLGDSARPLDHGVEPQRPWTWANLDCQPSQHQLKFSNGTPYSFPMWLERDWRLRLAFRTMAVQASLSMRSRMLQACSWLSLTRESNRALSYDTTTAQPQISAWSRQFKFTLRPSCRLKQTEAVQYVWTSSPRRLLYNAEQANAASRPFPHIQLFTLHPGALLPLLIRF